MKLLFVTDSLSFGGAAKMLVFVAEGLAKKGHECFIVNLNTSKLLDRMPSQNVRVFNADICFTSSAKTNYRWIKYTYSIVRDVSPSIIIGFASLGNFCASLVGRLLGIPSIIAERSDPFHVYSKINMLGKLKLAIINQATGAVFQSEGASNFYSKKLIRNCAIIPNPIFVEGLIPSIDYKKLPKTVVSLGRFDNKQKRYDILLKGFKLFHETHPDYNLNIYGSGPDESFVYEQIKRFDMSNFVSMRGKTSKPLEMLSMEGIFVITSDFEGISNSLMEAMAVGLPVVSTDHSPGGARMLIQDHTNGLLIPTNDPQALANALNEYANNNDLARYCGTNARQVLSKYTPEQCIESWDSFLSSMVS